ncbi:MAG: hypothetical protein ABEH81_04235 [Halopenitus sp.]
MSDTPHDKDCIELEEPERIDSLGQLDVGDRVLVDERRRPQTVIATGTREIGVEGTDNHVETPVVRVQGHWAGATTVELRHKIDALQVGSEGDVEVHYEEKDAIVETEHGREMDVRRTHVAGPQTRAETETERTEVTA